MMCDQENHSSEVNTILSFEFDYDSACVLSLLWPKN